jgi:hypothetical protein
MQPIKIEFYVYADSADEATALSQSLRDFVESKRSQGIAVTADMLTQLLCKYKDNFFVNNYLKRYGRK